MDRIHKPSAKCVRFFFQSTTAKMNSEFYRFQLDRMAILASCNILVSRTRAFLPSATVVAERLCFYTCLSVILFTGGCTPSLGRHPPRQILLDRHHPTGMHFCWGCNSSLFNKKKCCPCWSTMAKRSRETIMFSKMKLSGINSNSTATFIYTISETRTSM